MNSAKTDLNRILLDIVESAIEIAESDFGNIQLLDSETNDLKIVAQRGFPQFWLDFWNHVSKGQGACGTALAAGHRVIVEDITKDPIFIGSEALDVQLKAGVRAVQSTPLLTRSGKPLGMFSTHYRNPGRPSQYTLRLLDLLARLAADAIEQSQLKMELSKAVALREEFLSVASHELKTPLTSLKLQLQMIELGKNDVGSVTLALKQVESLNSLIEDLLDVSRLQSGKFSFQSERTDLSEVVESTALQFSEQLKSANCPIALNLQKPLIGKWDPRRIEQIVANLISNAIKYAPGSKIEVITNCQEDLVTLIVRDSGPGIPNHLHEQIFERFNRGNRSINNYGGLGLGLYIVRSIVEAKGGKIRVDSESGKGAEFVVQLPLRRI